MENAQRKREILDVCLATFIRRGLYETSVRDLSRALALQSGGIYYWFKDKDDVVVTCAEEAALRLEEHLIAPALQDIREPDRMMERLRLRADELRPMMKFFASVCACSRYEERLRRCWDALQRDMKNMPHALRRSFTASFRRLLPMCILPSPR